MVVQTKRPQQLTSLSLSVCVCTLADCFEHTTAPEEMTGSNAVMCSKCGHATDSDRFMRLGRLPKVLVLQMVRYLCIPSHIACSCTNI